MATRNETHVHDISTLANFKDWAQSISAALTAFGWTQTTDTGQVNWSTISAVPASGTYVYEIWQPGDGGTPFYIRLDYGNSSSQPSLKIQGGTGTNGSGTLTGFTTLVSTVLPGGNNGTTLYNCLYRGDSTSFTIMMWRENGANFLIAVDRSRNSSGAATNNYFTVICQRNTSITGSPTAVQSVVFGVGVAPAQLASTAPTIVGAAGSNTVNTPQSMLFNGSIGISPVFPYVGYYDVPTLALAYAPQFDYTELALITTTMLGGSHTFLLSKTGNMATSSGLCTLMRWE